MVSKRINTTLEESLYDLGKKNGIVWAIALKEGVKLLLREPFIPNPGEKHETQTKLARKEKQVQLMGQAIDALSEQITELKGGNNNVD